MNTLARFFSKVDDSNLHGCWPWRAGKNKAGYGVFEVGTHRAKKSVSAHRYFMELVLGRILSRTEFVCHRCDNPACVNPAHLFVGTPKQNTQDMIAKGRRIAPVVLNRRRGDNHPSRLMPERLRRGESHPSAKLTAEAVKLIRDSSAPGIELARRFGVSNKTVSRIRRNESWRQVSA